MGACIRKSQNGVSYTFDQVETFAQLGMSETTVQKLRTIFDQIDVDKSGEIDYGEFVRHFSFEKSKFAKRAFSVMDEDGSGEVDFGEFVLCVWNFCTFDKLALMRFAFEMYDQDGSGLIDCSELQMMIKELYGKQWRESAKAQLVFKKVKHMFDDGHGEAQITFIDFRSFCSQYPAMLFPAFKMQLDFQRAMFGAKFWIKESEKRRQIENQVQREGNGASFGDIMSFLKNMSDADAVHSLENMAESLRPDEGLHVKEVTPSTSTTRRDGGRPTDIVAISRHVSGGKGRNASKSTWRCVTCGRSNKHQQSRCATCKAKKQYSEKPASGQAFVSNGYIKRIDNEGVL